MLFKYKAVTKENESRDGVIDAYSVDVAISNLQRSGLVIIEIEEEGKGSSFSQFFAQFESVKTRDIVILSRQLATLFEAKVSALDSFKLMSSESENPLLKRALTEIADDVQSGTSISNSMAKHPNVFSSFFVNMVKSGEESGKLTETFNFLAGYLERTYELVSKTKNALLYPAFVIMSFFGVMILMLTFVIPKLSEILLDTGQEVPVYTKIIIGASNFLLNYGILLLAFLIILAYGLWKYFKTEAGGAILSDIKTRAPYVGNLYKMFYLSRIADNMDTLISSGVAMVRSVEITADVVDSDLFKGILLEAANEIKAGNPLSKTLGQHEEIPRIMVQMIKIGEETGNLGFVLKTMARFYKREVDNSVDTMVGLIEPIMIVVLGLAVGILLVSVLGPIYNITTNI